MLAENFHILQAGMIFLVRNNQPPGEHAKGKLQGREGERCVPLLSRSYPHTHARTHARTRTRTHTHTHTHTCFSLALFILRSPSLASRCILSILHSCAGHFPPAAFVISHAYCHPQRQSKRRQLSPPTHQARAPPSKATKMHSQAMRSAPPPVVVRQIDTQNTTKSKIQQWSEGAGTGEARRATRLHKLASSNKSVTLRWIHEPWPTVGGSAARRAHAPPRPSAPSRRLHHHPPLTHSLSPRERRSDTCSFSDTLQTRCPRQPSSRPLPSRTTRGRRRPPTSSCPPRKSVPSRTLLGTPP